jgi:hypothetical protein
MAAETKYAQIYIKKILRAFPLGFYLALEPIHTMRAREGREREKKRKEKKK